METAIKNHCLKSFSASVFSELLLLLFFFLSGFAVASDSVLVIRIEGKDFEQALKGIREETGKEIPVTEMVISRNTDVRELEMQMERTAPRLVILMDNISIKLYKKYQDTRPSSRSPVPSLSLMASFTNLAVKGLKNATGIIYEVPAVTSIVNLRSIMPAVSIRRVGVIYREFLEEAVSANRLFCEREHIELISCPLPDDKEPEKELKKGLEYLKPQVDALWVLNDSRVLTAQIIREIWVPFVQDFQKPVIVGVEVLVQPGFQFGTFGVIPDHTELGVQAAEMIFDIKENNWQVREQTVEQPRSVYKILNQEQSVRLFHVGTEQLNLVDKVLR